MLKHFADAYGRLRALLTKVRLRHAKFDATKYYTIFGDVRTDFHLRLPASIEMPELSTLPIDTESKTTRRLRQKALSSVVHADGWLNLLDAATAFDLNNVGADVRNREARRIVSAAQPASGADLLVTPDRYIRGSYRSSPGFIASVQYRAGLFISCLTAPLDARAARGDPPSQSDRLGDNAVNGTNATARHNSVNNVITTAMRAVATKTIDQGDKGRSAADRKAALKRWASVSADHVPDIYERGAAFWKLYEVKCYNSLKASVALGNGSVEQGGKPSTNEGHHIAFGSVEEGLRYECFGCGARGLPSDENWDHSKGVGRVDQADGYYTDALRKGHSVSLLITEVLGGVGSGLFQLLRRLDKKSKVPGHADRTRYGFSRTAPRGFLAHHARAIALSISTSVGFALTDAADAANSKLVADDAASRAGSLLDGLSIPSAGGLDA